jgi:hypothetical protein
MNYTETRKALLNITILISIIDAAENLMRVSYRYHRLMMLGMVSAGCQS